MTKKPSNTGKPWSRDDMKMLRDDVRQHTPTSKIAAHLKRTVDSIYAKASELHLSLKGAPRHAHVSRTKW